MQRGDSSVSSGRRSSAAEEEKKVVIIANRFKLLRRLGGGAFGEVFLAEEVGTGKMFALKLELVRRERAQHLASEARLYHYLNSCPITVGIPRVFYYGRVNDYNVMAMDFLGPTLEDLFALCGKSFNVKTVCMIGIQILHRMQFLHGMHYLHRDIKPENFVMGINSRTHIVFMIDIGLAKRYRDAKTLEHIPKITGKALTGTARYVSIHTHLGIQQSRRDDIESVAYLLMYFLRGSLPWQGLKTHKNDVRYERILSVKSKTTPAKLCEGFPSQFAVFVEYARNLDFTEEPDYDFCIGLLEQVLYDMNEVYDFRYQWVQENAREGSMSSDQFRRKLNQSESGNAMFDIFHRNPLNMGRSGTAIATSGDSIVQLSQMMTTPPIFGEDDDVMLGRDDIMDPDNIYHTRAQDQADVIGEA